MVNVRYGVVPSEAHAILFLPGIEACMLRMVKGCNVTPFVLLNHDYSECPRCEAALLLLHAARTYMRHSIALKSFVRACVHTR